MTAASLACAAARGMTLSKNQGAPVIRRETGRQTPRGKLRCLATPSAGASRSCQPCLLQACAVAYTITVVWGHQVVNGRSMRTNSDLINKCDGEHTRLRPEHSQPCFGRMTTLRITSRMPVSTNSSPGSPSRWDTRRLSRDASARLHRVRRGTWVREQMSKPESRILPMSVPGRCDIIKRSASIAIAVPPLKSQVLPCTTSNGLGRAPPLLSNVQCGYCFTGCLPSYCIVWMSLPSRQLIHQSHGPTDIK